MGKNYSKNTWLDEIISGAARYDIKDNGGSSLYTQVQILIHNTISQVGSLLTAAWMNNIEGGVDTLDDEHVVYTTGGTSTAFTLTTPQASALATLEHWYVKFNATAGATPTLNRDGKGAKNLKQYDNTGSKIACGASSIISGMIAEIIYDGTDYVVIDQLPSASAAGVVSGPEAFGDNYIITPSIASNNLTVALKTIASADPGVGTEITFRINNVKQSLAAALSVTVNAGTNTFNSGSAELKTQKQQLFVYAGWRASGGAFFMVIARFPWAKTFADFSSTATNELYGAYSVVGGGAAPASTDSVEVMGRIDVANSGTASYNWSLPTGATVVNRPIYSTDTLTYAPQWTGAGSNPSIGNGSIVGAYKVKDTRMLWANAFVSAGSSTTFGTGAFQLSLPFTGFFSYSGQFAGISRHYDSSANLINFGAGYLVGSILQMAMHANPPTDATHPWTWATSDNFYVDIELPLA